LFACINGEEAIEKSRQLSPDLIILDISMVNRTREELLAVDLDLVWSRASLKLSCQRRFREWRKRAKHDLASIPKNQMTR